MSQPYTLQGAVVGICITPQNAEIGNASPGFAGLTYVPIANVGNIGAYGFSTNMVSYPTMDRSIVLKAKGQTDGGNLTIQCADAPGDQGQVATRAAANPLSQDNYAFRIQFPNGAVHYLRGPVGGPNHPNGGPEAFAVNEYTIGVNEIKEVDPPVSP
jgi:hypothetical protein